MFEVSSNLPGAEEETTTSEFMLKFSEARTWVCPDGKVTIDKHLNGTVSACSWLLSHLQEQDASCSLLGSGSKEANSSAGLCKAFQKAK